MSASQNESNPRPGIAFQYAFDWLAVALRHCEGPVGYIEGSDFQTAELLRRMGSIKPVLPNSGTFTYSGIAWMEPCNEDLDILPQIKQCLASDGQLYIISGGLFSRFLEERRKAPNVNHANERDIHALLKKSGLVAKERFGIHGIRAIVWHQLGTIAARLGFEHLRDRCHYAMRRDFITRRAPAALVCLTAKVKD